MTDLEAVSRLLYNLTKPPGEDWWVNASWLDPEGRRIASAKGQAVMDLIEELGYRKEEET